MPGPRFTRARPTPDQLGEYTGTYYSNELGAVYEISVRQAELCIRHARGLLTLEPTEADRFVDLHDQARAHLATQENIEALELALANGMISTAHDALFNIVNFWLYCDDSAASPYETRVVRESLGDALVAPSSTDDPVLAALSLAACGRYAEAVDLLDEIGSPSPEQSSDWAARFFGPVTATKRARMRRRWRSRIVETVACPSCIAPPDAW